MKKYYLLKKALRSKHEKILFGFTLIELMITISIIVLMALISIPTFSTFQKKAQFAQTVEDVSGKISQYGLLAKNPELGIKTYLITNDSNGIYFNKIPNTGPTIILDKTIVASDFGESGAITIDGSPVITIKKLQCYVKTGDCCFDDNIDPTDPRTFCKEGDANSGHGDFYYASKEFLKIKNFSVKKQAIINVTDKPFSVNIVMSDL